MDAASNWMVRERSLNTFDPSLDAARITIVAKLRATPAVHRAFGRLATIARMTFFHLR
jgi:hypothetical protein